MNLRVGYVLEAWIDGLGKCVDRDEVGWEDEEKCALNHPGRYVLLNEVEFRIFWM